MKDLYENMEINGLFTSKIYTEGLAMATLKRISLKKFRVKLIQYSSVKLQVLRKFSEDTIELVINY